MQGSGNNYCFGYGLPKRGIIECGCLNSLNSRSGDKSRQKQSEDNKRRKRDVHVRLIKLAKLCRRFRGRFRFDFVALRGFGRADECTALTRSVSQKLAELPAILAAVQDLLCAVTHIRFHGNDYAIGPVNLGLLRRFRGGKASLAHQVSGGPYLSKPIYRVRSRFSLARSRATSRAAPSAFCASVNRSAR